MWSRWKRGKRNEKKVIKKDEKTERGDERKMIMEKWDGGEMRYEEEWV